jgi:hypothetical protein
MNKYKVNFTGFYYVEAETPEDAEDICNIDNIYEEQWITFTEEVDDFEISL